MSFILAAAGVVAPAHAGGPHALFILDANTGATLADQDGSDPRYPASLTKMMTLYLAFEGIEQGRLSMKTRIKISQAAANAQPSKLELAVGEEIALEDAISVLITKSANDIAIAVAEHIGGTEANFAKLMTAKARELGMKATTFKNASGLPNSEQTTTARDMVTLGVRLYDDFPAYFPLFSTRTYSYNGSTFRNHNTLMLQMPGINGIKTGYTAASGFNLVSSLQQDGRHVIGAIFGGETAGSRNAQMRVALSRALAKASVTKTRKPVLMARAEAKAAAEHTKKAKPASVAVAAVAKPMPVAEAAPVAPAAPIVVADAAPQPSVKFEVAKVRAVPVAEVAKPTAAPVPGAANTQPAPAFAQAAMQPRISDIIKTRAAPPPLAAPPAAPPAVTASGVRAPSSFETQMAGLAQNMQPAQTIEPAQPQSAASAPTAASITAPVAAARPPSSLGAQLAELTQSPPSATPRTQGMPQPSYRLAGPQATPAPAAASQSPQAPVTGKGFEIQIGAYASPAEADKRLAAVQAQFPSLNAYKPARHTVTIGDKVIYRARFAGFDQAAAHATCAELNRQAINCLALKAD